MDQTKTIKELRELTVGEVLKLQNDPERKEVQNWLDNLNKKNSDILIKEWKEDKTVEKILEELQ